MSRINVPKATKEMNKFRPRDVCAKMSPLKGSLLAAHSRYPGINRFVVPLVRGVRTEKKEAIENRSEMMMRVTHA